VLQQVRAGFCWQGDCAAYTAPRQLECTTIYPIVLPMSDLKLGGRVARPPPEAQRRSPSARRTSMDLQQRSRYAANSATQVQGGSSWCVCWRTNDRALGLGYVQSAVADQRAHAGDVAASRRGLAGEANSPGACLARSSVSAALLSFGLRRVRRPAGIGGRPLRVLPAWRRSGPAGDGNV